MKRCFGCFGELNSGIGICPYCGFNANEYSNLKWILQPGTIINGKYMIGKRLGEGGFGITYLGWDLNMETKVAVKEYYPSNFAYRDTNSEDGNSVSFSTGRNEWDYHKGLKKYVDEAVILSKFFDLPGVVSVKDFFYENNTAYIVMEYISGISLKDFLQKKGGKIPYDEAILLLKPVIQSLAIIHREGLLHRDISPDNIMIQNDGSIKLIDFGAARYNNENTDKSMTVVLKHGYAPIEQYSRNGVQGAYTDVYGICAVLYKMITGLVPLDATDRAVSDKYIPIKKIVRKTPKYIADAIDAGLSVHAEYRQQSMEELYSDLYGEGRSHNNTIVPALSMLVKSLSIIVIVLLLILIVRYLRDIPLSSVTQSNQEEDYKETKRDPIISENKSSDNGKEAADVIVEDDVDLENEKGNISEADNYNERMISDNNDSSEIQTDETEESNRIDHGITVASQGVLNGDYGDNKTVEQILNSYSDIQGSWSGYEAEDSDIIYAYYRGEKNGTLFVIEFEVYTDDTFRISGAAENGNKIDNYSEYFANILNSVN